MDQTSREITSLKDDLQKHVNGPVQAAIKSLIQEAGKMLNQARKLQQTFVDEVLKIIDRKNAMEAFARKRVLPSTTDGVTFSEKKVRTEEPASAANSDSVPPALSALCNGRSDILWGRVCQSLFDYLSPIASNAVVVTFDELYQNLVSYGVPATQPKEWKRYIKYYLRYYTRNRLITPVGKEFVIDKYKVLESLSLRLGR